MPYVYNIRAMDTMHNDIRLGKHGVALLRIELFVLVLVVVGFEKNADVEFDDVGGAEVLPPLDLEGTEDVYVAVGASVASAPIPVSAIVSVNYKVQVRLEMHIAEKSASNAPKVLHQRLSRLKEIPRNHLAKLG